MRTYDGRYINPEPSAIQLAEATLSRCVPGADTSGFSLDLDVLSDGRVGVTIYGQARAQRISPERAERGLLEAVDKGSAVKVLEDRREVYVPSESFSHLIQQQLERREREFQQFLKWERGEATTWQLPDEE